jgi:hypothetical protein
VTKIVISEQPPYFLDLDAPTLPAKEVEEEGVRAWIVWCRYCERWHAHGPGERHRIAHCQRQTPYTASGYNLALANGDEETPHVRG